MDLWSLRPAWCTRYKFQDFQGYTVFQDSPCYREKPCLEKSVRSENDLRELRILKLGLKPHTVHSEEQELAPVSVCVPWAISVFEWSYNITLLKPGMSDILASSFFKLKIIIQMVLWHAYLDTNAKGHTLIPKNFWMNQKLKSTRLWLWKHLPA